MRKLPEQGTRKRRSFLRSTGALVAATAIGGCSSNPLSGDERHQPVRTFAEGFRNDDIDTIRRSLHSESPLRESLSEQQISGTSIDIVTIETRSSDGDRATVQAQLEFSSDQRATDGQVWYTFDVRRDGEGWGIWQLQRGRGTPTPERTPTATESEDEPTPETETETNPETGTQSREGAVFYDGFEDDLSQWNVVESAWRRTSTSAVSGANSVGIDTRSTVGTIATADFGSGRRIEEFSYYWYESSASWGGGVRLLNDAGDVEIGTTSDNPQWVVDGGDGLTRVDSGTEYQRWVRVSLRFDWSSETAEIEFKDTESGSSYTGTHPLKRGENVQRIQIRGFTSERGWETRRCHMLWDDILARE